MRTLVGATRGGRERTCVELVSEEHIGCGEARTPRSARSPSFVGARIQKLCSRRVYRMRPRPKEGSMTFGVNSRTVTRVSDDDNL